jgi:hypothetical protein
MRRLAHPAALALFGCVLASLTCVYAPPVSFSQGTQWTFPLVDPLRGGKLVTPLMVDGRGPFLVALDPAAKQTIVDREVVSDNWGEKVKPQVELANLVLGDLTISSLTVAVSTVDGKLDTDKRRIFGVIGADVLTDELVFGVDRGRGIAWLSRVDAMQVVGATPINVHRVAGRRLVAATIGGRVVDLELAFGESTSQLRRSMWGSAGLDVKPDIATVVDRTGVSRPVTERGVAGVIVGTVHRDGVSFVPADGSGDGTLALDFFAPFVVNASWPDRVIYVRDAGSADQVATGRLARWGRQLLDACHTPGCVDLAIVRTERDDGSERVERSPSSTARPYLADLADGPSELYTFRATRDAITAGADLQVVFASTGSDGKPLPRIEVDMPAGADTVTARADPRFIHAAFHVVDVSPFPRVCTRDPTGHGPTGCVVLEPSATP